MRGHTESTEAYQLYLKGRYSWEKWTQDGARQAIQYFEEAIRKDPNYALAYSAIADAYLFGLVKRHDPKVDPSIGPQVTQKEVHRLAREAATKALSLDPQLGEAHAALAEVLLLDDWDFAGAERELKRALELNPSYAEGHHQYSHLLLLLGRINESLTESRKFLELDPISEPPIGHLGYHLLYARQYDEAIRQLKKDIDLYSDSPQHAKLGDAYYQKGMFGEAVDAYLKQFARIGFTPDQIARLKSAFATAGINGYLRQLLEEYKAPPASDPVDIAELYARLGEKELAFEWLEKAFAQHSDYLVRLKEEVGFDNLRSDPRYADLLRRVGLPQ
jgi:tetratricopeptide (TPR) repeat protein